MRVWVENKPHSTKSEKTQNAISSVRSKVLIFLWSSRASVAFAFYAVRFSFFFRSTFLNKVDISLNCRNKNKYARRRTKAHTHTLERQRNKCHMAGAGAARKPNARRRWWLDTAGWVMVWHKMWRRCLRVVRAGGSFEATSRIAHLNEVIFFARIRFLRAAVRTADFLNGFSIYIDI